LIVFGVGDVLGIATTVTGKIILLPSWAWFTIGTVALFVAQFLAFHKVRGQRDELRERITELEQSKKEIRPRVSAGIMIVDSARPTIINPKGYVISPQELTQDPKIKKPNPDKGDSQPG